MDLDVVFLSRLQFAVTIMFHYIFPPLSIGLGWLMVIFEGLYLKTRDKEYESIARFLTGIFAINFAVGVVTGLVMEFQFGTNWSAYSRYVGDVFGSALAAEGIFAFFLESGFLAVLVFGWDRVSSRMHFISTLLVALGTVFSAVWIVIANSWQQTPAGFHIVHDGLLPRAEITDFWAMVFNPSSMHRLGHVLIGAFILGAFFVMSLSAYYLLKGKHISPAKKMFPVALLMATITSLAALVSGHFQAMTVAKTQPAKLAAFEGHFNTVDETDENGDGGSALVLFGVPDQEEARVRYKIAIPGLLSFMVHGSTSEPVTGLDQFPREDWPPVLISFTSYRVMLMLGIFFIGLTLLTCVLWYKNQLYHRRWLMWLFVFAVIGPYIANQAGWVAAEVGRQPWVVYGLLRTSDAVSKVVSAGQVLSSLIMFSLIYAALFFTWLFLLDGKIKKGPETSGQEGY